MTEMSLSLAEKTFILHGINVNFRNDGRSNTGYRCMELETNILDQVNGSARLRIGNSDCLVGVKAEVDTPYPNSPYDGKLEFFVDCSANAAPSFEGRGGEDLANEINNTLAVAYGSSDVFDLSQLCILPHKKCWKLYVDILILECGGNLFDAVAAAVKAAFHNTKIPKIKVATLDGSEADIVISDDIYESIKLVTSNLPLLISLCKIGDCFVVDPSTEEEICSSVTIVVSVMPNERISSMVKIGYGSLQAVTLSKTLEMGMKVGYKMNKEIMLALAKEDELKIHKQIGFL